MSSISYPDNVPISILLQSIHHDTAVTGHEKLATFMARFPQTAIFSHFDFLNALNLFYMQAELVDLETELKDNLKED